MDIRLHKNDVISLKKMAKNKKQNKPFIE